MGQIKRIQMGNGVVVILYMFSGSGGKEYWLTCVRFSLFYSVFQSNFGSVFYYDQATNISFTIFPMSSF